MVMDLNGTRERHLRWIEQLKCHLRGDSTGLDPDRLSSAARCDLGAWLYDGGVDLYAEHKLVGRLESIHHKLHQAMGEALFAKECDDMQAVEAELVNIGYLSDELVRLLTLCEQHLH